MGNCKKNPPFEGGVGGGGGGEARLQRIVIGRAWSTKPPTG